MRERYAEAATLQADDLTVEGGEPGADPEGGADEAPAPLPVTQEARRTFKVRITDVSFAHEAEKKYVVSGETLGIRIGFDAPEPITDAIFGIAMYDIEGHIVMGTNTELLGVEVPTLLGKGHVDFEFAHLPLADGTYPLTVGIHNSQHNIVYDWREQGFHFEVMNPDRSVGLVTMAGTVEVSLDSAHSAGLQAG